MLQNKICFSSFKIFIECPLNISHSAWICASPEDNYTKKFQDPHQSHHILNYKVNITSNPLYPPAVPPSHPWQCNCYLNNTDSWGLRKPEFYASPIYTPSHLTNIYLVLVKHCIRNFRQTMSKKRVLVSLSKWMIFFKSEKL